MPTYSTNFGNPSIEATNWNSLQFIMEQLPDNTGQFISPRDVRDAVFTTWEKGVFKVLEVGSENYIGTDNGGTVSNFRYKMLFGKKELQPGNTVLNNSLLTSDTDIFIYNNKTDSNTSLQDTKMSFLAGDDFSLFTNAPYIESTKISGLNPRIDLNITNPSTNGIIEINSPIIELGDNNGWIVDDTTGNLYPQNNGQNIGLSSSTNRIGTIYMASTVDYLNDLEFISGTSSITFDTGGMITTESLYVEENLRFKNNAGGGEFLTTDTSGNATWGPGRISTIGITAGYMNVADGINDVKWTKPYADASGVTAGYILQSVGNSPQFGSLGAKPEWRGLDNLITGVTAGYVLGSDGSNSVWVPISSGAGGVDTNIQFNNNGFLDGDSNFIWDNSNKRLGIGTASPNRPLSVEGGSEIDDLYINTTIGIGISSPSRPLEVVGGSQFDDIYLSNRIFSNNGSSSIDLNNNQLNFSSNTNIGISGNLSLIGTTLDFEAPTYIKFSVEEQGFEVEGLDADIRLLTNDTGITEVIKDNDGQSISLKRPATLNLRYQDSVTPTSGTISSIRAMVGTSSSSNIYSSITFNVNSGDGEIVFRTTDTPSLSEPTERMIIDGVGNVGVGTQNPLEKLHISGDTLSGGTIITDPPLSTDEKIIWKQGTQSVGVSNSHSERYSIPKDIREGDANIVIKSFDMQPEASLLSLKIHAVGIGYSGPSRMSYSLDGHYLYSRNTTGGTSLVGTATEDIKSENFTNHTFEIITISPGSPGDPSPVQIRISNNDLNESSNWIVNIESVYMFKPDLS